MAWSIGLNIGETVIEIVGRRDSDATHASVIHQRTFIPHGGAKAAFQQFLNQNLIDEISQIKITSTLPLKIVESMYGNPAATLTTSGFEGWLEINTPLKESHFCSTPEKLSLPVDRELTFGINERTNAQGHIEKIIDETELEFLSAKLELHKITNVAVCFLHSDKNPENEKRAKKYLEQKGIRVFASHEAGAQKSCGELSRFWFATLNAYIAPLFFEILNSLKEEWDKKLAPDAKIFWGDHSLEDIFIGRVSPLQLGFSFTNFIANNFAKTTAVLYCGLEDFYFFTPTATNSTWASPYGPVMATHSAFTELKHPPLTKLGRSFFSEFSLTNEKTSFDPGPMTFGRSQNPTLFDALIYKESPDHIDGLEPKINEKGRLRFTESLSAYARNMQEGANFDDEDLIAQVLDMAKVSWGHQLDHNKNLTLVGPLAKHVKKLLGGHVTGDSFFVIRYLLGDNVNESR